MDARIDIEKTQNIVALVMEKIRAEVDPWLLDEYQHLFKKEVSLFHRSRVAAYLLMLVEQGKSPRFLEQNASDRNRQKSGRGNSARQERDAQRKPKGGAGKGPAQYASSGGDPQRYPLADKDSKWLFLSVGRSRRISPREILSLLNTKIALPKDDVGAIRILENYSFVQVRDSAAEKIIEALNGYIFRGRALVVNYARSRKDEEEDVEETEDDGAYGETSTDDAFDSAPAETRDFEDDSPEGNVADGVEDAVPDADSDQDGKDHP